MHQVTMHQVTMHQVTMVTMHQVTMHQVTMHQVTYWHVLLPNTTAGETNPRKLNVPHSDPHEKLDQETWLCRTQIEEIILLPKSHRLLLLKQPTNLNIGVV